VPQVSRKVVKLEPLVQPVLPSRKDSKLQSSVKSVVQVTTRNSAQSRLSV